MKRSVADCMLVWLVFVSLLCVAEISLLIVVWLRGLDCIAMAFLDRTIHIESGLVVMP
jgi:hypothetical protein